MRQASAVARAEPELAKMRRRSERGFVSPPTPTFEPPLSVSMQSRSDGEAGRRSHHHLGIAIPEPISTCQLELQPRVLESLAQFNRPLLKRWEKVPDFRNLRLRRQAVQSCFNWHAGEDGAA